MSDDTQQPPALPSDVAELLRGVTSKPVKVYYGKSLIWTGEKFEIAEAITAVLF